MNLGTLRAPRSALRVVLGHRVRGPAGSERRYRLEPRQSGGFATSAVAALGLCAAVLSACSSDSGPKEGTPGFITGFLGGAVADEPRAALVARDVLSAGGTAADAAVALYFTLAVTKPGQAGLGGGGACVVYNWRTKQTEALDFLAPLVPGRGVVPGNPRGMLALQAKHGKLRWEALVGVAERIARFETPISRSTARDLATARTIINGDPALLATFADPSGNTPGEGTLMNQPQLAGTLSLIRRAPQEFYTGSFARTFQAAAADAGQPIDPDAMRDFAPSWRAPAAAPFGLYTMFFAPTEGGAAAAAAWTRLGTEGAYERASPAARPALLAQAVPGAAEDPASDTSFVVADRDGDMVSCVVSMNRFFGSGRIARGTGIVLASNDAPDRAGGIAPMLAVNPAVPRPFAAFAGSGGAAGTRALLATALGVFVLGEPPDVAAADPRPDRTGLANLIYCPRGMDPLSRSETSTAGCLAKPDPRGYGLAKMK
jgi:gamma-glutamyltranspeptidase/glutathione hydrolase